MALFRVALLHLLQAALAAVPLGASQGQPPRVTLKGFGARIYAPAAESTGGEATPRLPTILFVSGFGGLEPASTYSKLLEGIVAKGFVVVGLDRRQKIDYLVSGSELVSVMDWAVRPDGLAAEMARQGLAVVPDVERIAVMGQSSGNHIIGEALLHSCGPAKAWVMIDPVDGVDPYRIVTSQDLISPGKKLNFTIPALMIGTGLDPKGVGSWSPPCAPAALSNDRFYDAMRGPIWAINATAYGHIDCLDSQTVGSLICPTDSHTDKDAYRRMLARATGAFLGALFGERPKADFDTLEDESALNVSVILKHDLKGLTREQVLPGCVGVPASQQTVVV